MRHLAAYFPRWDKAMLRVLGACDDVLFSTVPLAIFFCFGNNTYVSEVGGFNGDNGQHPISDMWPKSKMADTNSVANYQAA